MDSYESYQSYENNGKDEANKVYAIARRPLYLNSPGVQEMEYNPDSEHSIAELAATIQREGPLERVFVATGVLHSPHFSPEKSLEMLSRESFHRVFDTNTILPALFTKHFSPLLSTEQRSILALLSARVGSISDNRLGGWYAYRASKAALNMLIKTAAIEIARKNKQALVVGLHPGTVDSSLSKPFQARVADGKLFSPQQSVESLIAVTERLHHQDSGKVFDWRGKQVPY